MHPPPSFLFFRTSQKGQVLLVVTILFTTILTTVVVGLVAPILSQLRMTSDLHKSKQSYYTAEAGAEDIYYRIKNNMAASFPHTLVLEGAVATVTVTPTSGTTELIISEGNKDNHIRTVMKELVVGNGFSFNYGVQIDEGGLVMNNLSSVIGNVYSNGPITGNNNAGTMCGSSSNPKKYSCIRGVVISAGASGSVNNVYATSSAYAHSITNSSLEGDAYYATELTNTTVGGTTHPGSNDQPFAVMPISDELIGEWEQDASLGGAITDVSSPDACVNGTFSISTSRTLGPVEINCDLSISGSGNIVNLKGTIWVKGSITISQSPSIKVDDSVGNRSVAIIADNPGDRLTSSHVDIGNNAQFFSSVNGLGQPNSDSYIMIMSQNNSTNPGDAIAVTNNVAGNLLIYAPHGSISISNNVILREVTAYQLTLNNDATVIYRIGLAQPLFTSGPSGSWTIKRWKETTLRP